MKSSNRTLAGYLAVFSFLASLVTASPTQAATISVVSQTQGSTPFIWNVTLGGINTTSLTSIQFSISPKVGSVTQPISATYSTAYLSSQNRINSGSGQVTIAVFGLYASNQINLNNVTIIVKNGRSTSTIQDLITTSTWNVSPYSTPRVVTPRNNRVNLDYSFFYLRDFADSSGPVIIDTDGEVRWIGTTGCSTPAFKFYQRSFYVACRTGTNTSPTTLFQNNLDGSRGPIFDYAGGTVNASFIGHHNYDIGKQGLLLEINANGNQEQEIIEVSPTTGEVFKTFDFSKIISQAMSAGGDDPTLFVHDPIDWFHNNAATYWPSRNELVVSSREQFVISIDYTTQKIKWILGDPTKSWYSFKSLRKLTLKLAPGTIYPQGQHAVSITSNNELLLFDNDLASFSGSGGTLNPSPPYSAPRRYSINENSGTATETWQFLRSQPLYSPICSSVYQDGRSYLIDYASQGMPDWGNALGNGYGLGPEIMGIDSNKNVAFDFYYPSHFTTAWNSDPIHLENLQFAAGAPLLTSAAILSPLAPSDTGLTSDFSW
jgi:hypothetical protein